MWGIHRAAFLFFGQSGKIDISGVGFMVLIAG